MSIKKRLRDLSAELCGNAHVLDVRIGLTYTAVRLEDGRTGLAYTMGRSAAGCSVFRGCRPFRGKPADQLLQLLESSDPLETTLGLATCNSVFNIAPSQGITGDVLTALETSLSDHVVMVGYFGPLVPILENKSASLVIYEESESKAARLRPASEACQGLRVGDVAFITSTSIINGAIDSLLEAATRCREVALLGPSTPLAAEVFKNTPVTMLSGMVVDNPDDLLAVVSEACGTRFFGPHVTKWNVRLKK